MITLRPAAERGHAEHDWLDTWHTFSFAFYDDARWRGFHALRVINEDTVAPGRGFGAHPHANMEIVTVILSGALKHEDSMGNSAVIRPGEIQRMSAGTGVVHAEVNASDKEPVHLLQIWMVPESLGLPPGYEQVMVPEEERRGKLRRVASRTGGPGEVVIHQDAAIFASVLAAGESVEHLQSMSRAAWIQMIRGEVLVNGKTLTAGDGAGLVAEQRISIRAAVESEFLLFDLP